MRITGPSLILAAFFAVLGSPASPQSVEDLAEANTIPEIELNAMRLTGAIDLDGR
ncbi:uncharacterized protein METZ01_LOCUS261389, partial [marine metagenome]